MALRFKVLADPNRLAIFEMLRAGCGGGPCGARRSLSAAAAERTVGDIAAQLGIGVPTVSHHLKELWRAGLIRHERRGQRVYCSIEEGAVAEIMSFFSNPGGDR